MLSDPRYDEWFRLNLRCGQDSFVRLCDVLRRELHEFELDRFVKDHSFEEKVACLLYFLGSQGGYRETTSAFAISKSWAIDVVGVFLRVLRRSLRKFVRFPRRPEHWTEIENAFKAKGGIPGVVGAIDGSLVEINRPDDFEGYYCRKMFPALNVQAVVSAKLRFMSVEVRPGSWSDQKTWRASVLGKHSERYLPAGAHFLGDAGYAICPAIMTPYLENDGAGLTRKQLRYNYLHSRTRMAVECAFGLWKGRFRIVNCCLNTKTVEKAVDIIAATMVLHNILLDIKDDTSFEEEEISNINIDEDNSACSTVTDATARFLREVGSRKRESLLDFTEAFDLDS
eukprot:jgi/Phyca11/122795/e_gw1.49.217.1